MIKINELREATVAVSKGKSLIVESKILVKKHWATDDEFKGLLKYLSNQYWGSEFNPAREEVLISLTGVHRDEVQELEDKLESEEWDWTHINTESTKNEDYDTTGITYALGDKVTDPNHPEKGQGEVVRVDSPDRVAIRWAWSHVMQLLIKDLHKKTWSSLVKESIQTEERIFIDVGAMKDDPTRVGMGQLLAKHGILSSQMVLHRGTSGVIVDMDIVHETGFDLYAYLQDNNVKYFPYKEGRLPDGKTVTIKGKKYKIRYHYENQAGQLMMVVKDMAGMPPTDLMGDMGDEWLVESVKNEGYSTIKVSYSSVERELEPPSNSRWEITAGSNTQYFNGVYDVREISEVERGVDRELIRIHFNDGGWIEWELKSAYRESVKNEAKISDAGFSNSNLYFKGQGMDINGNHVVKVQFPNRPAFSIQTTGDLPITHRELTKIKIDDLKPADRKAIEKEIVAYVQQHGSAKQKGLLKTYKSESTLIESDAGFSNSNLYFKGQGMDINGNHVVKVQFPNRPAFSIQTSQNLPTAHRELTKIKIDELSPADRKAIEKEIVDYVQNHGSAKQKGLLKTYKSESSYEPIFDFKGNKVFAVGKNKFTVESPEGKVTEVSVIEGKVYFGTIFFDKSSKLAIARKLNDYIKFDESTLTERYPVGTRVLKTMGVRRSGIVIPLFYWKDSTDGTYSQPDRSYLPVQWDDGTKGYESPSFLIKESVFTDNMTGLGFVFQYPELVNGWSEKFSRVVKRANIITIFFTNGDYLAYNYSDNTFSAQGYLATDYLHDIKLYDMTSGETYYLFDNLSNSRLAESSAHAPIADKPFSVRFSRYGASDVWKFFMDLQEATKFYWKARDAGISEEVALYKNEGGKWVVQAITVKETVKSEGVLGLDDFTEGYLEALLWSSSDDEVASNGSIIDIDQQSLNRAKDDCKRFQAENVELLKQAYEVPDVFYNPVTAGHDFALTRNGHGAGFWDRSLGDIGDKLTDACRKYGEVNLWMENGVVSLEGKLPYKDRGSMRRESQLPTFFQVYGMEPSVRFAGSNFNKGYYDKIIKVTEDLMTQGYSAGSAMITAIGRLTTQEDAKAFSSEGDPLDVATAKGIFQRYFLKYSKERGWKEFVIKEDSISVMFKKPSGEYDAVTITANSKQQFFNKVKEIALQRKLDYTDYNDIQYVGSHRWIDESVKNEVIAPKWKKVYDNMVKQYGKEKGESVFYATMKKKGIDYKKESAVGQVNRDVKKGDLIWSRYAGTNGLAGLVIEDKSRDEDGEYYPVYFRGMNGAVMNIYLDETDWEEVHFSGQYFEKMVSYTDVSSYASIARKLGIIINPKYQEWVDNWDSPSYDWPGVF